MVFSFFKKDAKDSKSGSDRAGARGAAAGRPTRMDVAKPVARPLQAPVNRSLNRTTGSAHSGGVSFAVTENALPDRELARSLAMETAKKIDAIESEMVRDFLRPDRKRAPEAEAAEAAREAPAAEIPPVAAPQAPMPALAAAPAAGVVHGARAASGPFPDEPDSFDPGSDILAGSIDAIEVNGGSSAALDEAAILFANRQDQAAEAGLRAVLASESQMAVAERAALMLLEIFQQREDRAAFEQLSAQFPQRFGSTAPAWLSYAANDRPAAPAPAPAAASAPAGVPILAGMPVVQLPATIDSSIVKPLEELKNLAMNNPSLTLDVSAARSIDLVGAELLLRVVNAFKRASHELVVRGAAQLLTALRGAIEPGRRDPSDAAWMLLLEVQRMLDKQADFEETGIQYCITYEVSPPSWEPPLSNIRVSNAPEVAVTAAAAGPGLECKGEVLGDGEQFLGRLMLAARDTRRVAVECRQLRRMAFTAATAMLGHLVKLQQSGVTVEFRDVNCLVAALWQMLGITAVADARLRRA